jgi:hypothetical protein
MAAESSSAFEAPRNDSFTEISNEALNFNADIILAGSYPGGSYTPSHRETWQLLPTSADLCFTLHTSSATKLLSAALGHKHVMHGKRTADAWVSEMKITMCLLLTSMYSDLFESYHSYSKQLESSMLELGDCKLRWKEIFRIEKWVAEVVRDQVSSSASQRSSFAYKFVAPGLLVCTWRSSAYRHR